LGIVLPRAVAIRWSTFHCRINSVLRPMMVHSVGDMGESGDCIVRPKAPGTFAACSPAELSSELSSSVIAARYSRIVRDQAGPSTAGDNATAAALAARERTHGGSNEHAEPFRRSSRQIAALRRA